MKNIAISKHHINFFNDIMRYDNIIKYTYGDPFNDIENLLNICCINKVTIVLPLHIDDSYFINKHKQILIDNGLKFYVPTTEIIDIFNNKKKFHDFMLQNNLDIYVPKRYDNYVYPCILKNVSLEYGIDTYVIKSSDDLPIIMDPDKYIILEPIYGNIEYTTHIFAVNGKIKIHTTVEYYKDKDLYIRSDFDRPLKAIFIDNISNEIFNIFEKIMQISLYTGVCCINYKIIDNIPIIFEINPRFGGSLISSAGWFTRFIETLVKL